MKITPTRLLTAGSAVIIAMPFLVTACASAPSSAAHNSPPRPPAGIQVITGDQMPYDGDGITRYCRGTDGIYVAGNGGNGRPWAISVAVNDPACKKGTSHHE